MTASLLSTPITGETLVVVGAGVEASESIGAAIERPASRRDATEVEMTLRTLDLAKSFLELKNFDEAIDESVNFIFGIATPFCVEHRSSNIPH